MDIEPLVYKHFQLWKTQLGSKFEDTLRNALTEQAAYYENLVQVVSSKRVPEGYVLVQQFIHPLECAIGDNGDKVMQLLANAPDAGPFDNPQDFYQHWWQKLLFAAAPQPKKEKV